MKKMRKILRMGLVVILIFVCSLSATFATTGAVKTLENDDKYEVSGYLSEKALIDELQAKGTEKMKEMGYTEEEIKRIMSISDESVVNEMKMYTDDKLRERGFSEKEIIEFRKLAESDLKAAAKIAYAGVNYVVSVNPGAYYYTASDNVTHLTTVMTWEWQKEPLLKYKDIVALSTNSTDFIAISYATQVNYYRAFGANIAKTIAQTTYTADARTKTYCTFDMQAAIGGVGFGYSGRTSTYWNAPGKRTLVAFAGNYGHTGFQNVMPSISVGTGLSISFGPSDKVEYGPEASGTAQLK